MPPSEEDIRDPRVVPRWVEAGVSGVPRQAEWDYVTAVELVELEGSELSELAFLVLSDGTVVGNDESGLPDAVRERLAVEAERAVRAPCEALAVRRGLRDWSLGVRRLHLEPIALSEPLQASSLEVVRNPDGELEVLVDGEEPAELDSALEAAVRELERRGFDRYPAFVVVAARLAGNRWELTVDPL